MYVLFEENCKTITIFRKLKRIIYIENEPFTLKEAQIWCDGNEWAIRKLCNQHFKKEGQRKIQYYI